MLGRTPKGGIAAVMQSATDATVQTGAVRQDQASDIATDRGVTISEANIGDRRVVNEAVGGQIKAEDPQLLNDNT